MADEKESRDRRAQIYAKTLETQTSDLRFMTTQYAARLEQEQKRADEARDRAEQLLSKLGLFQQMKGQKATATAESLFQRLQKIDVETGLGRFFCLESKLKFFYLKFYG